jgi:protein phosphatase
MKPIVWVDTASAWTARVGGWTDVGSRREENHDYLDFHPTQPIAIVLDGHGCHPSPVCAIAADVISRTIADGLTPDADARALIGQGLRDAHNAILRLQQSREEYRACGATVVVAVLHGGRVHIGWLGDAMAYRVTTSGIEHLTTPHDLRHYLIEMGQYTAEEAQHAHIKNVLMRDLGAPEFTEPVALVDFVPRPGDRLLLGTDGLVNFVPEEQLLAAFRTHADAQECAEQLIELALENHTPTTAPVL